VPSTSSNIMPMGERDVLNERTSWTGRLALLRERIPPVLSKGGTALYIGASPSRFQLGRELHDAGYEITLLEAWEPNAKHYLGHPWIKYIVNADVRKLGKFDLPHARYDLVVWWHGPEHVTREELPATLQQIEGVCTGIVLLGCPWGRNPQGAVGGNEYERHSGAHYPEDFNNLGYETAVLGGRDQQWSHIMAWKDVNVPSALVSFVIVNFKTLRLTKLCFETLRKVYPEEEVILIDNGSQDESTEYIRSVDAARCFLLEHNIGHGPALHLGTQAIRTPYMFALDSDCVVLDGDFLEPMMALLQADPMAYATGWVRYVDLNGIAAEGVFDKSLYCPYAHPAMSLYKLSLYRTLPPFMHEGAPAVRNMQAAKKKGYKIIEFDTTPYIRHLCAGTRRLFGGRWNPKEGEKAGEWSISNMYPI